jgi:hypothetical protein
MEQTPTERVMGTLNFLLSPITFLIELGKWAILLTLVFMLLLWNWSMWVIGLGSNGLHAREHMRGDVEQIVNFREYRADGHWADFQIDFGHRDVPYADYETAHQGLPDDPASRLSSYTGGVPATTSPFTGTRQGGDILNPFEFCRVESAEGSSTALPFFFDRSDDALRRKAARMRHAYVVAGMMAGAIRYTVVRAKFGLPVEDHGPRIGGARDSFCNADQYDVMKQGAVFYKLWAASTSQVIVPDAPQVDVQIANVGPLNWTKAPDGQEITGMCLVDQCDEGDLMYSVSLYGDLFDSEPGLTPGQLRAEAAMLHMGTEDYWLHAAQVNGVKNTAPMLQGLKYAWDGVRYVEGQ